MGSDLVYQIALTMVPNIGAVHAKTLLDTYGSAAEIFRMRKSALEKIEGIGPVRAFNLASFRNFKKAEEEISFIEKYRIKPLFIKDPDYPQRFLNCYDPPTMFYFRGNANLNHPRIIAVVGTRTSSEYGRQATEQLIKDLSLLDIIVVSGLAFGIDAQAHKAALKNKVATIGVVGHGLDTIYPPEHKTLAKEMIANGGILTEFPSRTKPDKHNFPIRNRIVAGITDATILVETGIKGGSMITAEMANGYNRDVFAFPGRATDPKSSGCNYLIKNNKAILLTDAAQLAETLGWTQSNTKPRKQQMDLFIQLSEDEKKVIDILSGQDALAIDEINLKSALSTSAVASVLLNLELQGLVVSLPGKMYKMV